METRCFQGLDAVPASVNGCVLTIGNFDGVHRGHRKILQTCRQYAAEEQADVVAMTFEPPPDLVLRPNDVPQRIDPPEEKVRHLLQAGADYVAIARADPLLLAMAPEEFVNDIVVRRFAPRHIVEGRNFYYGLQRSGNVQTLREAGRRRGFEVHTVEPVVQELRDGPRRISSSTIRLLVQLGRIPEANDCLDREFTLHGTVIRGKGLGGRFLLPTANLDYGDQVVPIDGVYAGRGKVDDIWYPAAISVGTNPTLGPTDRTVEAYLLGAAGDLYDKKMALSFVQRLRDQVHYDDIDELREQMEKDVMRVREIVG